VLEKRDAKTIRKLRLAQALRRNLGQRKNQARAANRPDGESGGVESVEPATASVVKDES
jgi:hypothetical protein